MGFKIPIDVDYFDHPKTLRLAEILRIPEADAYPIRLWRFAALYAKDGRIPVDSIEGHLKWRGKKGALVAALRKAGFLEGDLVHDWKKGIGHEVSAYEAKKDRQRILYHVQNNACRIPAECEICRNYSGLLEERGKRKEEGGKRKEEGGERKALPADEAAREPAVIRWARHAERHVNPAFGFPLWADTFRRALAFGVPQAKLEAAVMSPEARGKEPRGMIRELMAAAKGPGGADDIDRAIEEGEKLAEADRARRAAKFPRSPRMGPVPIKAAAMGGPMDSLGRIIREA